MHKISRTPVDYCTPLVTAPTPTMSSKTAYDLSIPELLCILDEKLDLECTRVEKFNSPPLRFYQLTGNRCVYLDPSTSTYLQRWGLTFRSRTPKPEHGMF